MTDVSQGIALEIAPLERPVPVYVLGDSHCLSFADLEFEERQIFKQRFFCRARAFEELPAAQYLDQEELHPRIQQYLQFEQILDETGQPAHLAQNAQALRLDRLQQRKRRAPILIFFVGQWDLDTAFLPGIKAGQDFALPFLDKTHPEHKSQGTELPFRQVLDQTKSLLEPALKALFKLKQLGFYQLYLHALPPPASTAKTNQSETLSLRYKATLLFNHVLETLCCNYNLDFITLWSQLTQQQRRHPAYHLDDKHLNQQACILTMQQLFYSLSTTYRVPLIPQYQRALNEAQQHAAARQIDIELRQRYLQEYILSFPAIMPQALIEAFRSRLRFEHSTSNLKHYRLDWVGNPISPYSPDIQVAQADPQILQGVYQFLYFSPVRNILESCMGTAFTVSCCRWFKSLPTTEARGPQVFHRDMLPPGAVRAVVYLTDVDQQNGPFEYQDPENGESHYMTGPAGTLLIFDADAITHRGSPPAQQEREVIDLVLLPAIAGIEPHIIWPGLNHWPVDPYHYSLYDYVSWPRFQTTHLYPGHPPSIEKQQALQLLNSLSHNPDKLPTHMNLNAFAPLQLSALPLSQLLRVSDALYRARGLPELEQWLSLSHDLFWQAVVDTEGLLASALSMAASAASAQVPLEKVLLIYLDGIFAEHAAVLIQQFSSENKVFIVSEKALKNLPAHCQWQQGGPSVVGEIIHRASALQYWSYAPSQAEAFIAARLYALTCTLPEGKTHSLSVDADDSLRQSGNGPGA